MGYAYITNFNNDAPYVTNITNDITIAHNCRTRTLTNGSNYGDYQAASATNIKYTSNLSLDKKYNKIDSSYTAGSKDNTYSAWKGGVGISQTAGFTGNHSGRCQVRATYKSANITIALSNGESINFSI